MSRRASACRGSPAACAGHSSPAARRDSRAAFGESLAHAVDVEAELAGLEALARPWPPSLRARRIARGALAAPRRRTTQTPSSSATITSPGSIDAPAHTTGTLTLPSVSLTVPCADIALRPDRKAHLGEVAHVAHAASMTRPRTPRLQRAREQLAEVAGIGVRGRRDDEDVAVAALLDRHVDHPVVAGRHADRHRRARDARPGIDRPHARPADRCRPCASWTVATPQAARPSITAVSARGMFVVARRSSAGDSRGIRAGHCPAGCSRNANCKWSQRVSSRVTRGSLKRRHVTAPVDHRGDREPRIAEAICWCWASGLSHPRDRRSPGWGNGSTRRSGSHRAG